MLNCTQGKQGQTLAGCSSCANSALICRKPLHVHKGIANSVKLGTHAWAA
jgi:hypothetical protein